MNVAIKKIIIFVIVLLLLNMLSGIAINAMPTKMLKVISESMAPAYHKGDLVFFKQASYNVNNVVVYKPSTREDLIVMARIVAKNADGTFKVKGDANTDTNPALDQNSVKADQILGKVVGSVNFILLYIVLNSAQLLIAFVVSKLLYAKLKL